MAAGIRYESSAILQWPIIRTTVAVAGCSPGQAKPNNFRCASGVRLSLVTGMTGPDELDADTVDQINQFSTRVGMLMEDAAPLGLDRSESGPELKSMLLQLQADVTSMASLIAAAKALANV